jgi:hypothetical protein
MSEIITDKLTGKTAAGDVTITSEGGSATMQLQQGVAKSWIDIPDGLASINDSLNVSSLDDDGTGNGGINLTASFSSANYAIAMGAEDKASNTGSRHHDLTKGTKTSSGYDFETYYHYSTINRTNNDLQSFSTMFGDLA